MTDGARPGEEVLEELVAALLDEGFGAEVITGPIEQVIVTAQDTRLDPWDDPDNLGQLEVVRIDHRDGQLFCPWLPGPVADADLATIPPLLRTLIQTRGY